MDATLPSGTTRRRVELRIVKRAFAWFARPTVTIDGVGHPAQWGTGTWVVPDQGTTIIGVHLFNRAWHFGAASAPVPATEGVLEYRGGLLPFGAGTVLSTPR